MHPNEKVLRNAIDARATDDDALLAEYVDRDALTHFPGRSPLAGDHRGRGALGAHVREITGHHLDLDVHDVLASDDHVVGLYLMSAERDGRRIQWRQANVYHVRDGKIVEVWQHPFDEGGIDEFFS